MNWIIIPVLSYLFSAVTVMLDKFLLGSKRIPSAPTYAFYSSLLGLVVLFLIPFGFSLPSILMTSVAVFSGIIFNFGILALYFAIKKAEASRVMPVVGAVVPIATYFLSVFLGDILSSVKILGAAILIFGGILISFDLPLKINKKKFFSGFCLSILSGILMAIAYLMFKYVYQDLSFVNGFIWTRIGALLGGGLLLVVPSWRKEIWENLTGMKKKKKGSLHTAGLFISNKILAGISFVLLNFAISIGNVTIVNSLISVQYVFILLMAYSFSKQHPEVFEEKLLFWDWAQKIAAIFLIGIGIFFIYL